MAADRWVQDKEHITYDITKLFKWQHCLQTIHTFNMIIIHDHKIYFYFNFLFYFIFYMHGFYFLLLFFFFIGWHE